MDHPPQLEHLSSDYDWDGAGGLTCQNHWGAAVGSLSLFGISVIDLYLIDMCPHADFSPCCPLQLMLP